MESPSIFQHTNSKDEEGLNMKEKRQAEQSGYPSISRSDLRHPTFIDLTGEDHSPISLEPNAATSPPTVSTILSEHDATQHRKRQRQASSPNSNGLEEEPRKRTRRAIRMRSQSNLAPAGSPRTESPIPWVSSDIAGVSYSRSRRVRRPTQKWRESEDAGADGGAVPDDVPVQSPTSSSQPCDELNEHEAQDPEIQALKSRIAELEQERNEYHDSLQKVKATSKQQGQKLLILQTRILTASTTANKPQSSRQEAAQATWPSQVSTPSTVEDSIIALDSEPVGDQAGLQSCVTASTTAFEAVKAAYDVVRERWPEMLPDMRGANSRLLHLPAIRQLVHRPRPQGKAFRLGISDSRNLRAALCQVAGVEPAIACDYCLKGHGIWDCCVVSPASTQKDYLRGRCANCFYNGLSGMCTWTNSGGAYTLPLYAQARDSHERFAESHSEIQSGILDGLEEDCLASNEQYIPQLSARDDQVESLQNKEHGKAIETYSLKGDSGSQRAETGMEKGSSRQWEKIETSRKEKEKQDTAESLPHSLETARNKLDRDTAYQTPETKTIREKVLELEVELANLRNKNTQLTAEVVEKKQLQDQVHAVEANLAETTKAGARKEKDLSDKVARLETDLACLQGIDRVKRQLEIEMIKQNQEIVELKEINRKLDVKLEKVDKEKEAARKKNKDHISTKHRLEAEKAEQHQNITALNKSIEALNIRLEELGKENEGLDKLRRGAELAADYCLKERLVLAKASENALQREKEKHEGLIFDLEAKVALLTRDADAAVIAAESYRNALEEEREKHAEERRSLEAKAENYRISRKRVKTTLMARVEEMNKAKADELKAKGQEVARLQAQKRNLEFEVASLTTEADRALERTNNAFEERAKHAEERCSLEGSIAKLHDDLEAAKVLITTKSHEQDAAFQERSKLTKAVETLEAEVQTVSLSLEAKTQEETILQDKLLVAESRILSLVATLLLHEKSIEEQKAQHEADVEHIKALNKELSELRDKKSDTIEVALAEMTKHASRASLLRKDMDELNEAFCRTTADERQHRATFVQNIEDDKKNFVEHFTREEQLRLEAYNAAISELETATRQFKKELEGAGRIRLDIQTEANRRISELEAKIFQLEEYIRNQTQRLMEAKEEGRQAQLQVKADEVEHRMKVEILTQSLRQLEATSSRDKGYQQRAERFLDYVRSQLSREIEDEVNRDEKAAEEATMEGLQVRLTRKLDVIERERNWYKQRCDEYWEKYLEQDRQRRRLKRDLYLVTHAD